MFAQRRLRPDEVLPEWQRQRTVLGDADDVAGFVRVPALRLGARWNRCSVMARLLPQHIPQTLRERLADEGIAKPLAIDFHYPPAVGARFVHRSHPLVALLADHSSRRCAEQRHPRWRRAQPPPSLRMSRS